jgi:hypothetical protein
VSRGALITLLLVVAALLVPFALVGLWTHQVLLDRERFTNLAGDLLDRQAVRRGLADRTVEQLVRTRHGLSAGEPALRAGIESALTAPEYRNVFKQTLGELHDQLTSDEDTLRLDVGPTVEFARARLPAGRSLPPGSQVPPVVIARRTEVPVLWGVVDAAQRIALVTPLLVLAVVALAVAMARRRWLTLGVAGSVGAGVSLLLLGLIALAKQIVARRLDALVSRDAFEAAWDVIARSLTNASLIVVLGALVVAAGGFVVHLILTRRPAPSY